MNVPCPVLRHAHDCDCHSRSDGSWYVDPACTLPVPTVQICRCCGAEFRYDPDADFCPRCARDNAGPLPYDLAALHPGVVFRLTDITRVPAQERTHLARVTSVEQRREFLYVGWEQPGPSHGYQANAGSWGYTRVYPEPPRWGTIGIEVVEAAPADVERFTRRADQITRELEARS